MEAGANGVHGHIVAKRAVVGHGMDHGAARTHRLNIGEDIAWDIRKLRNGVTRIRVQVRNPEERFTEYSC